MANIKDRIKELRKEKGLTQEELAKMLGLSAKSNIANYENGANAPSDEIKLKMCEIFGCTIDYLMGKSDFKTDKEAFDNYMINQNKLTILKTIYAYHEEYIIPCCIKENDVDFLVDLLSNVTQQNVKETKKKINSYINSFEENKRKKIKEFIDIIIKELINDLENKSKFHYFATLMDQKISDKKEIDEIESNRKFYMCPVYGQISAGQPNWAEECIEGRLPIDPNLMNIVDPEECYFLRVNGESMNKVVKNGAYALIRKTDWVDDGEIAVVLVNGYDATLKKFSKQGDFVVLEPMSNDPSFQTQIYTKDTPIKIIGKYIGKFEMKN